MNRYLRIDMKAIPKLDTDLKCVAAALNITVPHARKLWLKGAFPGNRLGHRTFRWFRFGRLRHRHKKPPAGDSPSTGRFFFKSFLSNCRDGFQTARSVSADRALSFATRFRVCHLPRTLFGKSSGFAREPELPATKLLR
jgi:hypothetical protein